MTSKPIRLSTNFMTLIPNLTFTDYEWFPWSICNGCGMPAGKLTLPDTWFRPTIVGLACAPIVETRFLELAMSLLDFSPQIPLGTFSILLIILIRIFNYFDHFKHGNVDVLKSLRISRHNDSYSAVIFLCNISNNQISYPITAHYKIFLSIHRSSYLKPWKQTATSIK